MVSDLAAAGSDSAVVVKVLDGLNFRGILSRPIF